MQFSLTGPRRNRFLAWLAIVPASAVLLAVALQSPGESARATTNCTSQTAAMDANEQSVLQQINDYRVANGLGALKASPTLANAAAWMSEDASPRLPLSNHNDSLGRTYQKRASDCGYPYAAGENIGWGFGVNGIVPGWKGSAGHNANLLNKQWVVAGIGYYGGVWTATFGAFDDSGSPAPTSAPATVTQPATATATKTATTAPTSTSTPTTAPPTATPTATLTPYPEHEQPLEAGFNFMTYDGNNGQAALRFAPLGSNLIAAYAWDAAAGRWQTYFPGAPAYANTLEVLDPGDLLFLQVAQNTTWLY